MYKTHKKYINIYVYIPSGKLTWQWKMDHLKMYSLKMGIFQPAMLDYRSVYLRFTSTFCFGTNLGLRNQIGWLSSFPTDFVNPPKKSLETTKQLIRSVSAILSSPKIYRFL